MSVVSGVTFLCTLGETDVVEVLEALASETTGYPVQFTEVQAHYGGNKHPQQTICGAGLNYFDEDAFAARVLAYPWVYPENVVLVIQPEDGPTRVWQPTRSLWPVADPDTGLRES